MTPDQHLAAKACRSIDAASARVRLDNLDMEAKRERLQGMMREIRGMKLEGYTRSRMGMTGDLRSELNDELDCITEGLHIAVGVIERWSAE